jgi:hypothetical protein
VALFTRMRNIFCHLTVAPAIDRSALEQAREGLGGRDIEEPLIGLGVQKSTLEERDGRFSTTQFYQKVD